MLDKQVTDKSIKEEGERMVPAFHRGFLVYGEHINRYESIAPIVKGKVVLDIASGSGYGTLLIANSAKKVYGVEVDIEAVDYSKKNYSANNVEYIQGSAEQIPLKDASVDVVVTFETIEHIKDYKKFLKEIKRVLKPGGIAVISTPNDPEFPEGNHFHLHEFTEDELRTLLKASFKNVDFSYQYTWLAAAIISAKKAENDSDESIPAFNKAPVPRSKAIYFMAICSDEPIKGINFREMVALSEHWSAKRQMEVELANQQNIKNLKDSLRDAQKELARVNQELHSVYNSKSWKLSQKLANVKRRVVPSK